ncbi:hypothetical protein C8T65DRAFT_47720 [Cerioporus squamosus]|nr:hypothetical protein C8T65DRAFT_47720 [Cerioporus squamosus]
MLTVYSLQFKLTARPCDAGDGVQKGFLPPVNESHRTASPLEAGLNRCVAATSSPRAFQDSPGNGDLWRRLADPHSRPTQIPQSDPPRLHTACSTSRIAVPLHTKATSSRRDRCLRPRHRRCFLAVRRQLGLCVAPRPHSNELTHLAQYLALPAPALSSTSPRKLGAATRQSSDRRPSGIASSAQRNIEDSAPPSTRHDEPSRADTSSSRPYRRTRWVTRRRAATLTSWDSSCAPSRIEDRCSHDE